MEKITLQAVYYTDPDTFEEHQCLIKNGVMKIWSARDLAQDCPEDATLCRMMTNVATIVELMKLTAGKELEILPAISCATDEEYEEYDF